MVYRPNIRHDLCFVLLPLRSPFIGYFEQIIKPAALEAGLTAVKADDIYGTRAVIRDIWEQIWQAKAVVAIVTGKNANVNYELGICHTLGIPTVLLTDKKEDVPFDYQHRRYIRYKTDEAGWEQKLREGLTKTLKSVLATVSFDDELPWPYDTLGFKEPKKIGSLVDAQDSLDLVMQGVELVHRSVALAFGPHGKQVSVNSRIGPTMQRRGMLIARGVKSADPLESRGIEQMQRLASQMRDSAGDGTKTAIILAHTMMQIAKKSLEKGFLPKNIVAGMRAATDAAVAHILTEAKPCDGKDIFRVAVTASGDREIATILVEAMKKAGKDGVITLEASKGPEFTLEIQEGLYFDRGFLSSAFITDEARQECVLEDAFVLVYEKPIQLMAPLLPLLESIARAGKPILIIAETVEGEALATLAVNNEQKTLSCVAIKAPGYGDSRQSTLEDIAIMTGAKPFVQERLLPLQNVRLEDLGRADKVTVTRETTTILGGGGVPSVIAARIKEIRHRLTQTTSDYDREKLQERLAKLAAGLAVIQIGGLTDSDQAESMYRAESAMHSTHAAVENGCVIGGGIEYLRAKPFVEKLVARSEEEKAGITAVANALEEPLRQLLINSRAKNPGKIFETIRASAEPDTGFNADTGLVERLGKAGIFDPAKTLKEALLLAFSYSKGIIETGAWDMPSEESNSSGELEMGEPSQ